MATAIAIIAVTSGVAATVAFGSGADGSRYRTATAALQDVAETMNEVGTIQPISQAAIAFPTAGTVADVEVQIGDTVQIGDVLATLDTESLETDVRAAQAALDKAKLTLESARSGESITEGSGTNVGTGEVVGLTATGAVTATLTDADEQPNNEQPGGSTTVGDDPELADAQQAVIDAQRQVDANLRAAAEALASAEAICDSLGEDADTTTTTTTTTTTAPAEQDGQPASTTSTTSTTAPANQEEAPPTTNAIRRADSGHEVAAASACYDALAAVLDTQQATQSSQNKLAEAADALDTLLAERATTSGTDTPSAPTGSTNTPTGSAESHAPSSSGQSAPSGSISSSAPSSEDLIAYQKAVDEAELQLLVVQHALDNNTIVSPITGTVVSVDIEPGQAVDAASDTATIVVAGDDAFEITADVSVDDLPELEVGQAATLVPDGSTEQVTGEIVAIGLAPSSGTTGTTYQITIAINDDSSSLRNGSVASIDITTAEATQAIAIPTSAVKVDNGQYYTLVLNGDTAERTDVDVGAIGTTWTEITDGLEPGDAVVIADLDEPLPGTATETDTDAPGGGPVGGGPGGFLGQPGN